MLSYYNYHKNNNQIIFMVDCIYIEHIRINCKNGENVVLKVELKQRFCIKMPETF